jgi:hypothetical protein
MSSSSKVRAQRCKTLGLPRGVTDHSAADRHILLPRLLLRICRETEKREKRQDSQARM